MRIGIAVSTTLGCLFIFLAGFNVWNMLSSGGTSSRSGPLWIRLHQLAGYSFIAIFTFFLYGMALRMRGWSDELSPRLIMHIGLALVLAPLIFAKVIVARNQKAARGLLAGLGIGIFAASFTLVALNLGIHFLRDIPRRHLPLAPSVIFALLVLGSIATGIFERRQPRWAGRGVSSSSPQATGARPSKEDQELTLTLSRVQAQTHDAKSLRFLLPAGKHLRARPGQFLAFEWVVNGKKAVRCYSISSSPNQLAYIEITPKRVPDGYISKFLNDEANPGLTVKARGPYGKFYLDESKHKRVVLLAAGSGITPMIAMLRYMDDLCLGIDTKLIYCVRTEADVFFSSELTELQIRMKSFRYALVLSQPSSEWKGWKGRVTREMLEREIEKPLESTFFLCGPPAFMDHARSLLNAMAVRPSSILQESFGGDLGGKPDQATDDRLFKVTYTRSVGACDISPDQTLLENSELNAVSIPYGCRQGVCGTCLTKLISGNVEMGNVPGLTEELRSQGYILPCVSRALNDLVLDA
jgi:glycine betaine catabolism B